MTVYRRLATERERGRKASSHLWAIVLAGGEGQRMWPFIEASLGQGCPKQYCTFVGNRSMLQHTLDRVQKIVGSDRILTVIGRGHRAFLSEADCEKAGRIIEQPANFDTAAGIFLPITYIYAADPTATVLIFPSDHFVHPEPRFVARVRRMGRLARSLEDRMVLLGYPPDCPEAEYGWIEPGEEHPAGLGDEGEGLKDVASFREKPSASEAQDFFNRGYLWNTMIMATQVRVLWSLGRQFFPELLGRFEVLRRFLASPKTSEQQEKLALSETYRDMVTLNFSRDLLQRAPDRTVVFPLRNVEWSDWGRPSRLVESLDKLGKGLALQVPA